MNETTSASLEKITVMLVNYSSNKKVSLAVLTSLFADRFICSSFHQNLFGNAMRVLLLIPLALIFLSPIAGTCNVLTGKVISVSAGDTITILDKNKSQHKIRLYGIDCPEDGQAFGYSAKKYTSGLTLSRNAKVTQYETAKQGQTVGIVEVDGLNVNESIIRAGYAWQYRENCKEPFCRYWLQLEREARVSMRGLWDFVGDPVPPWEWRKNRER